MAALALSGQFLRAAALADTLCLRQGATPQNASRGAQASECLLLRAGAQKRRSTNGQFLPAAAYERMSASGIRYSTAQCLNVGREQF